MKWSNPSLFTHSFTPPTPTPNPNPTPWSPNLPFKHLTSCQYNERHAKGFYYYCDENFHTGHCCQAKKFLLLLVDENKLPQPLDDLPNDIPDIPQMMIPILLWYTSNYPHKPLQVPQTLKFTGSIMGHKVNVLIDTTIRITLCNTA